MVPPLETLPPGDPSGGVVYLRIVLSPDEASRHVGITKQWFSRGGVVSISPNPQAGGPPLVGHGLSTHKTHNFSFVYNQSN